MKVRYWESAQTQGVRPEMQDVVAIYEGPAESVFFGIFDGHGEDGDLFAIQAAESLGQTTETLNPTMSAIEYARVVRSALRSTHKRLARQHMMGGTTATVAVCKDNVVATACVGDSPAYYYPYSGDSRALAKLHDGSNSEEIDRVKNLDFSVVRKGHAAVFGGEITVSRAIGDYDKRFMSPEAEITSEFMNERGILAIGSDGVWGTNPYTQNAFLETLQLLSVDPAKKELKKAAEMIVDRQANLTRDNASLILAAVM